MLGSTTQLSWTRRSACVFAVFTAGGVCLPVKWLGVITAVCGPGPRCPYHDGEMRCCIKALPSQPCLGTKDFQRFVPLQFIALLFFVFHVLGCVEPGQGGT
jgi:hypothetical protein